MSATLEITLSGQLPADVQRVVDERGGLSTRAREAVGAAAAKAFRSHFNRLPANKLGWPSTNFYKRAARATNYRLDGDGVLVSVNQVGVRQRLLGGEIRPVKAKFLTIPASEESYGKRAGDFSNLVFAMTERGPALVKAASSQIKIGGARKDGSRRVKQTGSTGGEVMFLLRRRVTQKPNPNVLPPESEVITAATTALRSHFRLPAGGAT